MRAARVGEVGDDVSSAGPSRALMTGLSGAAVVLGLVLHVLAVEGPMSWAALLAAHEGAPMPTLEATAWLAATALGIWHVLPKAWYAARSRAPDSRGSCWLCWPP